MEKGKSKLEKKLANVVGKVTVLTKEEVYELIIKPLEKSRPVFDYLHSWRCRSLKSNFTFDYYSNAA